MRQLRRIAHRHGVQGALVALMVWIIAGAGAANAAFPGQNGKLLYYSNSTGQLVSVEASGANPTPLRAGFGGSYSPDGSKVAFASSAYPICDIYVMNADSTDPTALTSSAPAETPTPGAPAPCEYGYPSWSPDGSKIVYTRLFWATGGNRVGTLEVMDADGNNVVELLPPVATTVFEGPVWSPDGSAIAYGSRTGQNAYSEVFVLDLDTMTTARVSPPGSFPPGSGTSFLGPDWSPDGTRLVFWNQYCNSGCSVYVVDADGTDGAVLIAPGATSPTWPVWSPDGTKIAYNDNLTGELLIANADGSNPAQIAGGGGNYATPQDWQPLPADPDADNDGVPNDEDNCPALANADQEDRDLDDIGDACDPDADGDGLLDTLDADGGSGSSPAGQLALIDDTGLTSATLLTGSLISAIDVDAPKGIRITAGDEGATLTMCAQAFGVELEPNTSVTLTCSSVTVENILGGPVTVVAGTTEVTFPATTSGTVDTTAGGAVTVTGVIGTGVLVNVGGVPVSLPPGNSTLIQGGPGNSTITGTSGNDVIVDLGGFNTIDGKGGNDSVTTGAGNDTIDGGDGNDVIDAGGGNNTVRGGKGDDTIIAGSGNDTIDGGQGTDSCTPGGLPGKNSVKNCSP